MAPAIYAGGGGTRRQGFFCQESAGRRLIDAEVSKFGRGYRARRKIDTKKGVSKDAETLTGHWRQRYGSVLKRSFYVRIK